MIRKKIISYLILFTATFNFFTNIRVNAAALNSNITQYTSQINQLGRDRKWSNDAVNLINDMLNQLYLNYNSSLQTNLDYPSLDSFVSSNIMIPIKNNLNTIVVNKIGSSASNSCQFQGLTDVENKKIEFNNVPARGTAQYNIYMQTVLHEINHLNQKGVSINYFLDKESQLKTSDLSWGSAFLLEGDSAEHQSIVSPILFGTPNAMQIFFIRNSASTKECTVRSPIFDLWAYDDDANYYKKFEMLAGYQAMLSYKSGKITFDDLTNIIDKKYGYGTGWRLYSLINDVNRIIVTKKSRCTDQQYNDMVALETLFLNCLSKDINKLNNREDVKKYINTYRTYKNLYMPYFSEYNKNIMYSYTRSLNDCLPIQTLEDALVGKGLQYNVFPVFDINSDVNKKIIKSLFYVDYIKLLNNSEVAYETPSQPSNLFVTNYTIKQVGGNKVLTISDNVKAANITISSNGNVSVTNIPSPKLSIPILK